MCFAIRIYGANGNVTADMNKCEEDNVQIAECLMINDLRRSKDTEKNKR